MNESIMMPQAQFRSRLNSLPIDLKCELGEIPLQKGLRPTTRKEKVIEILNKYNYVLWLTMYCATVSD